MVLANHCEATILDSSVLLTCDAMEGAGQMEGSEEGNGIRGRPRKSRSQTVMRIMGRALRYCSIVIFLMTRPSLAVDIVQ